jgi:2',3'-cyclic-nucleotide 2'-phosphodiesterase/3'-nucleotidase/5'-nucleotidase
MMKRGIISILAILAMIAIAIPPGVSGVAQGQNQSGTEATVSFTILHTNDFHGNLERPLPIGSTPGMARTAKVIKDAITTAGGADNVLLVDAGDIMQGTLLSNLFKGESTIDVYNSIGYEAATFGNHEFDWSQQTLISRTLQADFPFVSSNIVVNDTGNCATAGWTSPSFADPWITKTVGTDPNTAIVGILGVTSQETPYITLAGNTAGLCFKDPADSISHYYQAVRDAGADVMVVLSHLGLEDGGYGYGFSVYGDKTLAAKLNTAGSHVDLIIGGHSHTNMSSASVVGGTTIGQAYYAGRKVGQAVIVVDTDTNAASVTWTPLSVSSTGDEDPDTAALIAEWASDPWYQSEINRVVGFTNVPLTRNYYGDSLMGKFINDAIYNDLNNDDEPLNDVDMVFNNPGGLRTDITFPVTTTLPVTLTHGMLYSVLPFGNATVVGEMTGAHILELLNQSAMLNKGSIQVAGIRFKFFCYGTLIPDPYTPCSEPYAFGAYDVQVLNRGNNSVEAWEPLDLNKTYRIATNEFLAPAGQDLFYAFKYVTNISYWGDMLNQVEDWASANYTYDNPYNRELDGRIAQNGTNEYDPNDLSLVVPVTILHNNDSHGNADQGTYVGFTQLATLINQYRGKNPDRTLLLNAGDTIQGDAMAFYYKAAFSGFAADGTALDPSLQTNPIIAEMNAMEYDAMTLGNHEFNFGNYVFTGTLGQAAFPLLGANVSDDGAYGLDDLVQPSIITDVPGPDGDIELAILGITNHRIPKYELPSNIPGLTFSNPITTAMELAPDLAAESDAVIALTHIGFTQLPGSIEVDNNVDTYLAEHVEGIDAIIGGHSHTNPSPTATGSTYRGDYYYLPAIVPNPADEAVIINQAYRYDNFLGLVSLGFLPDGYGGYDLVTRAGTDIPVSSSTPEDPAIDALITPYTTRLNTYNNTVLGTTTQPLDALQAYTQETNAANLQADSAVWELAQHGIDVDFYLAGAMTNKKVADTATPSNPVTLKVSDMFTLMPYENSLVTLDLNGPQLKTLLERSYRNYYYYKYVPGRGGYSYYTTCFLDISSGGEIKYRDTNPHLPDGNNVLSLTLDGIPVDFTDATTYYHVASVNYLAAGSCNFNEGGDTIWPLDQIVNDTQYYVRDSVINYITAMTTIGPVIEGRLQFLFFDNFAFFPMTYK